MNNKIAIESLSMDLKRIAIGFHRGSDSMAIRFIEEALKRKAEVDTEKVKPYLKVLLDKMAKSFEHTDRQKIAEDALMYSTLLQNYSLKNFS